MFNTKEQYNTIEFRSATFAPNGHLQTILGSLGRLYQNALPSIHHRISLADGDKVACEVSTPPTWVSSQPTIFLLHGMAGAHDSRYMTRMAMKTFEKGYRTIRMNMRGCGSGLGLCKRPYHGGLSDDLLQVIKHFQIPLSPSLLIGYSLGGNVTLKLAGEQGSSLKNYLKGIITVCPPYNMNKTVDKILSSRFGFYESYFVHQLRSQYKVWAANNPEVNPPKLPRRLTLIGFDDFHTAPRWGFKNARHYYDSISSVHYIPHIDIPCYILCTADDPVCDTETLHMLSLPSCMKVWKSPKGGHMGFLGSPVHKDGSRWLEDTLMKMVGNLIQTVSA